MKLHTLIGEISKGAYGTALVIADHGSIDISALSSFIDRNDRTIRRYLSELQSVGLVERNGGKVSFTQHHDKKKPDLPQVWAECFEQYGITVPMIKKAKAERLSLAFRKNSPSIIDWEKVRSADWPISYLASLALPRGTFSKEVVMRQCIGQVAKEDVENAPQIKDSESDTLEIIRKAKENAARANSDRSRLGPDIRA